MTDFKITFKGIWKTVRRRDISSATKNLRTSKPRILRQTKAWISLVFRDIIQASTDVLWKFICQLHRKPAVTPAFEISRAVRRTISKKLNISASCISNKLIDYFQSEVHIKVTQMLTRGRNISSMNLYRNTVSDVKKKDKIVSHFIRCVRNGFRHGKSRRLRKAFKLPKQSHHTKIGTSKPVLTLSSEIKENTDLCSQINPVPASETASNSDLLARIGEILPWSPFHSSFLKGTTDMFGFLLKNPPFSSQLNSEKEKIKVRLLKKVPYNSKEDKLIDHEVENRDEALESLAETLCNYFGSSQEVMDALLSPCYDDILIEYLKKILSARPINSTENILKDFIVDLKKCSINT